MTFDFAMLASKGRLLLFTGTYVGDVIYSSGENLVPHMMRGFRRLRHCPFRYFLLLVNKCRRSQTLVSLPSQRRLFPSS